MVNGNVFSREIYLFTPALRPPLITVQLPSQLIMVTLIFTVSMH